MEARLESSEIAVRCDECNGDMSDYAKGEIICVWCSGESED